MRKRAFTNINLMAIALILLSNLSTAVAQNRCSDLFSRSTLARAIERGRDPDIYQRLSTHPHAHYVHGAAVESLVAADERGSFGIAPADQYRSLTVHFPEELQKSVVYAWEMDASTRSSAADYAKIAAKDLRELAAFGLGFEYREAVAVLFRPLRQRITYAELREKLASDYTRIANLDDPNGFKVTLRRRIKLLKLMLAKYSEEDLRSKAEAVEAELKLHPRRGVLVILKPTHDTRVVNDPESGNVGKARALLSPKPLPLSAIEAIIPLSHNDEVALEALTR